MLMTAQPCFLAWAISALIAYSRELRDPRQALRYARRLAELDPANAEVRQLVERLESEAPR
jgi:DNA-directed RNA polymerase subunit F